MMSSYWHRMGNYIKSYASLWDNLYDDIIVDILNRGTAIRPEELAQVLVEEAYEKSQDKTYLSPFAKKAQENKKPYLGGKPDDITVIVALVTNNENLYTSENTSTTDHDKLDEF
jgi:hypothetical protein